MNPPRISTPIRADGIPIAITAAVGMLVVGLALPRVIAAVLDLPARPLIAEVRAGGTVSGPLLRIAKMSRAAALDWAEDGPGWADLGLVEIFIARQRGYDSSAGQAALKRSAAAHRHALGLDPAQAYAWVRLAQVELATSGPSAGIGRLLMLSVETAPNDRDLVFPRLDIGLKTWPWLGPRPRALVLDQVMIAAAFDLPRLAALAKQHFAVAVVRRALTGNAALRAQFDAVLTTL